ncbi:hypothetical protein ANCCAN_19966 [Ancylostoma caninum]|uniref:Uncharacterized protein n=1 Tax=Ancylostoma caninum TaxID=29170 RepID=A0A368FPM9_ANCCA|nr:hypothetical protein ANCCAN_19966 [Ancylostoma caninum]
MDPEAQYQENLKRRRDEELKLIQEIRYKRSCVRLAPTFPSKKEIQKRIKKFLRIAIQVTRSNNIGATFAELRGNRPEYFARMEASLYKSRIEILRLEAYNVMERVRSAGEGLAMTYELYKFLIRAEDASEESQRRYYQKEEEGVSLDPAFTSDFIRKELDFVDNLKLQMDTEIREAELQMENENRDGAFQQLKETICELRQDLGERCIELQEQLSRQNDVIKSVVEGMETIKKVLKGSTKEVLEECASEEQPSKNNTGDECEEDLLSWDGNETDDNKEWDVVQECDKDTGALDTEGRQEADDQSASEKRKDTADEGASHADSRRDSNGSSGQGNYPGAFRRREIEDRMMELRRLINKGKGIPERTICHSSLMREQERYMKCAFCFAKGMHYSDCCPIVSSVSERRRRIRCRFCLDTWHSSDRCRRPRKRCNYCKSDDHHAALCIWPEHLRELYREYDELREELETFEEYYGPSTSSAPEYHGRD